MAILWCVLWIISTIAFFVMLNCHQAACRRNVEYIREYSEMLDAAHETRRKRSEDAERLRRKLKSVREALEEIVETSGEDCGIIYLSSDSPTKWDDTAKCQVYVHENFSELGDALVGLHRMTSQ